jgi:hypothetical protein
LLSPQTRAWSETMAAAQASVVLPETPSGTEGLTVGVYLEQWLPTCGDASGHYDGYAGLVRNHAVPRLGLLPEVGRSYLPS